MLSEVTEKWKKRKKGHFPVYTKKGKRFVVPLCYLNHPIFRILFEMAEEEIATTARGPIQVHCEEEFMDYILSLLKKNPSEEEENGPITLNTCNGATISVLFPIFHFRSQGVF